MERMKRSKWKDERNNTYIYKEKSLKCKTNGIDVKDILDKNENIMRILILDYYKSYIDSDCGLVSWKSFCQVWSACCIGGVAGRHHSRTSIAGYYQYI